MSAETENKLTAQASSAAPAALENPPAADRESSSALSLRVEEGEEARPHESRESRLDHLPMQLDVMVKVRSFRVEDLLALTKGTVVETIHEHAQDIPVQCGGALLVWAEFEVVEQNLAVRVTRLA
ncbi:MAG TPA: FliM/FliN family flagellar motor C-terminal domain-containing protein [Acidobacteriaceae bacterium]|nr:FliM/FliN family flagellar motor C-terminal domain-containing protein [Acidobacteriaceae bacterium]